MLRLAMIGIGAIANEYIDLISKGKVEGVCLTALCSRSERNMHTAIQKYKLKGKTFTDYTELLGSKEVDAVLLCTPHGLHPSMARQALESGIHVLMEKPVGIFPDEITQLLEVQSQKPELQCGVMYNRRASNTYRHVKQLVKGGSVGELVRCTWIITNLYRTSAYYASSPWRGNWQSEGGGLLMTQASHQLDLMQWICGMPVNVMARCSTVGRTIQVENEAELFVTYSNGAHGHFIASAHESPGTNYLEICGTHGRITVREDSQVEFTRLTQDEREFAKTSKDFFDKVPQNSEIWNFKDSDNRLQQAKTIQNFAEAIEGVTSLQCSLEDGVRSLQIIQGAYLSDFYKKEMSLPVSALAYREFLAAH